MWNNVTRNGGCQHACAIGLLEVVPNYTVPGPETEVQQESDSCQGTVDYAHRCIATEIIHFCTRVFFPLLNSNSLFGPATEARKLGSMDQGPWSSCSDPGLRTWRPPWGWLGFPSICLWPKSADPQRFLTLPSSNPLVAAMIYHWCTWKIDGSSGQGCVGGCIVWLTVPFSLC